MCVSIKKLGDLIWMFLKGNYVHYLRILLPGLREDIIDLDFNRYKENQMEKHFCFLNL